MTDIFLMKGVIVKVCMTWNFVHDFDSSLLDIADRGGQSYAG